MRNKEKLRELLNQLKVDQNEILKFEEQAITKVYRRNDADQSFIIKFLSILGGALASFVLVMFVSEIGLNRSNIGMLTIGLGCMAAAIWISRKLDKIIYDTLSASLFIIGNWLLYSSLEGFDMYENTIFLSFIFLGLVSLYSTQNYIVSLISTLIINQGVLQLILTNNSEDILNIYISLLALGLAYLFLNEAKLVKGNIVLSRLYSPLKTGILLSFVICLAIQANLSFSKNIYPWFCFMLFLSIIFYFLSGLFKKLEIKLKRDKIVVCILSLLILLPTALLPAISGTILIILLSFLINYKTGFIIGILGCVYFLSKFYYDLSFSLLTKSMLLFSSGMFFLLLYFLTNKRLSNNEEI